MKKSVVAKVLAVVFCAMTVLAIAGCGGGSSSSSAGKYKAGTYTGEGQGRNGTITVTLTVGSDGNIASVDSIVADPGETKGIGGQEAIDDGTFAEQIVAANGSEIDGVSGATVTTNGVIDAVNKALESAAK